MQKPKNLPLFARLQFKTMLLLTVLLLCVMGALSYFEVTQYEMQKRQELGEFTRQLSEQLSNHLTLAMWVVDDEQVRTSANAAFLDPRVVGVNVTDQENRRMVSIARNQLGDPEENSPLAENLNRLLRSSAPIRQEDRRIGQIEVFVTPRHLESELRQAYENIVLRFSGVLVILLIFNTLALQYLVVRPIYQLAQAAERISQGDLEKSIQFPQQDEIGLLARSFERMRLSLKVMLQGI